MKCEHCGSEYEANLPINTCLKCGGLLEVIYENFDLIDGKAAIKNNKVASMWKYIDLLPHPSDAKNIVSIGEGAGELIFLKKLSESTGLNVYARYYGTNPTGTHKDLGMSIAFSMAKEIGITRAITYSTGNAGTSLSAYASRAGIKAFIISRTTISEEKLINIAALGGNVILIDNLENPWELLSELSKSIGAYHFTNFLNPYRAEGHKTLAYDIFNTLNDNVCTIYEPLGTGGGIWGTWRGYRDLIYLGLIAQMPRIVGVQPEAVKHAVIAFQEGKESASPYGNSKNTEVLSLADSIPLFGDRRPIKAVRESGGNILASTDEETKEALLTLGREGLFVEPASATALVGLRKELEEGKIDRHENVVLSLTGTGLKQPSFVKNEVNRNVIRMSNLNVEKIKDILQGGN
ncbi:MAG: pyridoxal-phosphate dependent enzyme [Nitrososphaerota archaeon]